MLCPNCRPGQSLAYSLSVNAQKVLRLLQSNDYDNASRLKIDPELAHEIEKVISGYLKHMLEKEVKSAAWLETLREQRTKLNQATLP